MRPVRDPGGKSGLRPSRRGPTPRQNPSSEADPEQAIVDPGELIACSGKIVRGISNDPRGTRFPRRWRRQDFTKAIETVQHRADFGLPKHQFLGPKPAIPARDVSGKSGPAAQSGHFSPFFGAFYVLRNRIEVIS
jgi:hypothetical protein